MVVSLRNISRFIYSNILHLLPSYVSLQAIETCSNPTPAGLCCNDTCANCIAAHPEHCLSCNHGYFMRDHGNHSICTDMCAPGEYRNYSSGRCSQCGDMFQWCSDCETVDRSYMEIIEKAISPECETWCGDQQPQPFDNNQNATLMCRFQAEPPTDDPTACKPGSVLISGCSCCVQSCPVVLTLSDDICIVSYRQKIRQKIADFTEKHCPVDALYCWSIAVGAASLVVLFLIGLCCCCCCRGCCRCKKSDKVSNMELQTRGKLSADDGHPSKVSHPRVLNWS